MGNFIFLYLHLCPLSPWVLALLRYTLALLLIETKLLVLETVTGTIRWKRRGQTPYANFMAH